jgi:hypothetical protein
MVIEMQGMDLQLLHSTSAICLFGHDINASRCFFSPRIVAAAGNRRRMSRNSTVDEYGPAPGDEKKD